MVSYYLLIVLAGFLQTMTAGFFWPALVLIWAAGKRGALEVYGLAFFGGLFVDLVTGRNLGISCLVLLVLAAVVLLFRSRFKFRLRYLLGFFFLFELLYHFFVF